MKVLCHLSGGYDSVAALLYLLDQGKQVSGLFFDLNQEYVEQEKAAAVYVSEYCKKNYDNYDDLIISKVSMDLQRKADGSPSEYIPVRNFVLGAHSANIAISRGFDVVAVGSKTIAVRPNDPYSFSDCSVEFYEKMTDIVQFCTESGDSLEYWMPLVRENLTPWTKAEVVKYILQEDLDISKLWTCYNTLEKSCGTCYHCKEAKKAFDEINFDYKNFFIT